ncbi:hypothetical protein B7494_g732 [Chlorociboria aeruginascens]|nr:hypothetical protein B7494_g732 [Chlorociboria aeruginascens]
MIITPEMFWNQIIVRNHIAARVYSHMCLLNECHPDTNSTTSEDAIKLDPEQGLYRVREVRMGVEGMDCTSCADMVRKFLESQPSVSKVRVSLINAQAVFQLRESTVVDEGKIISTGKRITGFTFTKLPAQSIGELDILIDLKSLSHKLPSGVNALTVVSKNIVRVSYDVKTVGARELLVDPFFSGAKLAPVSPPESINTNKTQVKKLLSSTIISAVVTIPVMVLAYGDLPKRPILYGSISLALSTIVQVCVGFQFYIKAGRMLIYSGVIGMDFLVVLSSTTAYVYSVVAFAFLVNGKPLSTGDFFVTSTLLVTLIMVGRFLSTLARTGALKLITIESLQEKEAILLDPEPRKIDSRLLQYGDVFQVPADTIIPTDGTVTAGVTEIDESHITGESQYVLKTTGMDVLAGSVNRTATITVRLTKLPGENTIKTVAAMIDKATISKPRVQSIADYVAAGFVYVILLITVVVFAAWIAIQKYRRHADLKVAAINAMTYAISVLIVSCPCAIGLAVPMVVVIAGGVAAKHGLIFRDAQTMEIAQKTTHIVFDKTGTLTQGKLFVESVQYLATSMTTLESIILGITYSSQHPICIAVTSHLQSLGIQHDRSSTELRSIPGYGIEGKYNEVIIKAGNPRWLGIEGSQTVRKVLDRELSTFCVVMDGELVAIFGLQDELRSDALETINQLKRQSIDVSIISGDNQASVMRVARQLGIPSASVKSECTPSEKKSYVEGLRKITKNIVVFCGDGTNDAPALKAANIGIHINEGTDIAQSAADVILMRPSLTGILTLIALSKAFYRRVVFNFVWSFVYNVFAILLAAGAFVEIRIQPQYAGLGELVSVVPVILIAMQLKWAKF